MVQKTKEIGATVRKTRKAIGITQKDLALTSGTGLRFIIDLEKGKPTCQLDKVLTVLQTLGIKVQLHGPVFDTVPGDGSEHGSGDVDGRGGVKHDTGT
ncbi:MAG: helix-turn-helix transcriptional regulator [Hyphomicrobiales bacterium]